jgi:hypothetical protein
MDSVVEILKVFLPLLALGATCYLLIRSFFDFEKTKAKIQAQNTKLEIVVPARMQAYERIVLYLERITPESLIRRTLKVTSSSRVLQSDMVSTIRNEYDHNLSQQVYMSHEAWTMVKTATEETIRLVNIAGSKLPATALATELAENILRISAQIGKFPTQVAIDNIKKEFAQYFIQQTGAGQKAKEE